MTSPIGYASRTGTKTTLAALREAGWRLLVTPQCMRTEGFAYGLDNGAWTAFTAGRENDLGLYQEAVDRLGDDADWIVAPDIVAGGLKSLLLTEAWLPKLAGDGRKLLVAVQDGMHVSDVAGLLSDDVGIFVGGSDRWKEQTMTDWGDLAAAVGCYLHIARVNTRRRMNIVLDSGADSFDGTSPVQFPKTLEQVDRWRKQGSLFGRRRVVPTD